MWGGQNGRPTCAYSIVARSTASVYAESALDSVSGSAGSSTEDSCAGVGSGSDVAGTGFDSGVDMAGAGVGSAVGTAGAAPVDPVVDPSVHGDVPDVHADASAGRVSNPPTTMPTDASNASHQPNDTV